MPDNDAKVDKPGARTENAPGEKSGESPVLPAPPAMPKTEVLQQYNQQINIQQIPQQAFDMISPEQIVKIYESTLQHIDSVDKRHFEFALHQAQKKDASAGFLGLAA